MSEIQSSETAASSSPAPGLSRTRWLVLLVLTGINLLNYIDRYIFSALLPAIKADLHFSDTELGLLGSGFIFAYLFISPVFGYFGDRGPRSKVMAAGVTLWSAATAFTGLCQTYVGQMTTRIVVGLGESAYSVIAPSTISDYFPKTQRGKIFAIYSAAIPVGSALGYVIGGILEPIVGWRHSFFVVGVPGVLLAVILFFMKDPKRGMADELAGDLAASAEFSDPTKRLSVLKSYQNLFSNGGFLCTVLGYAAYTFVVGGMAFWMPTYIVRYFEVSLAKGNTVFGGVTVVGGLIGTLIGGWWADRVEKKSGNGFLKVSAMSMVIAVPLFFLVLEMKTFNSFAVALFFMEIALFLCMSPLDAAVIGYVRPSLRATAMALNVFLIHLLGDGISRALMGAVSDASDLRSAIFLLPWVLLLAGALWLIGMIFYWQPMHWPEGALELPKWQAHRGFRPTRDVQENTLSAFEKAAEAGAVMLELDVHLTKDHQAVVMHDDNLDRVAGHSSRVIDLNLVDLKKIANAPSLREVLESPRVPKFVNIELKSAEGFFGHDLLEQAVQKTVRELKAENRVLFSSFNPLALRRISKYVPQVPRALLVSEIREKGNAVYLRKMMLALIARPHLLHLEKSMITESRMSAWQERSIPVAAWTVNEMREANAILGFGARSIITDNLYSQDH